MGNDFIRYAYLLCALNLYIKMYIRFELLWKKKIYLLKNIDSWKRLWKKLWGYF